MPALDPSQVVSPLIGWVEVITRDPSWCGPVRTCDVGGRSDNGQRAAQCREQRFPRGIFGARLIQFVGSLHNGAVPENPDARVVQQIWAEDAGKRNTVLRSRGGVRIPRY